MSTVYSKLQEARKKLQNLKLNKSGKNKFSNYDYFELSDFLPRTNEIFHELKLCSVVNFEEEVATLTVVNSEKPEEVITFKSPMRWVELKGCHPIQNLGAVQSYMRRYLYLSCMEIVENDVIEETTNINEDKPKKNNDSKKINEVISEAQTKRLYALGTGKDTAKIKSILKDYGFNSATDITKDKYKEICEIIEML